MAKQARPINLVHLEAVAAVISAAGDSRSGVSAAFQPFCAFQGCETGVRAWNLPECLRGDARGRGSAARGALPPPDLSAVQVRPVISETKELPPSN